MKKPERRYVIDGTVRSESVERQINAGLSSVFRGKAGREALEYLESITLKQAHSVGIDPTSLMHIEGQRYIVALIKSRIQDHLDGKLNVQDME